MKEQLQTEGESPRKVPSEWETGRDDQVVLARFDRRFSRDGRLHQLVIRIRADDPRVDYTTWDRFLKNVAACVNLSDLTAVDDPLPFLIDWLHESKIIRVITPPVETSVYMDICARCEKYSLPAQINWLRRSDIVVEPGLLNTSVMVSNCTCTICTKAVIRSLSCTIEHLIEYEDKLVNFLP